LARRAAFGAIRSGKLVLTDKLIASTRADFGGGADDFEEETEPYGEGRRSQPTRKTSLHSHSG
jgi:hypothetical protein